ncbi:hypothetical protein ACFLSV_06910 [Bacteroidota bacterium]
MKTLKPQKVIKLRFLIKARKIMILRMTVKRLSNKFLVAFVVLSNQGFTSRARYEPVACYACLLQAGENSEFKLFLSLLPSIILL